jgi:hypothetical protein
MRAYKDIEKRKLYQKLWAREKAIKKKAMILEPIIEPIIIEPIIVEINHNPRKLYRIHNKDIIAEKAKICIISSSTIVNSVSFINIPTTTNIFTFIMQPSNVNSPYYIRPSSNTVNVNSVSIPLYGLLNVSLPSSCTYIVQSISIIYNLYASTSQFVALTSVSAY